MLKNLPFKIFYFAFCLLFFAFEINAQNSIENLLSENEWNLLFPKRAGITAGHPQGYSSDFYSYNNFKQAVDEMADYLVEIRKKDGVWGELITITKKSTNESYIYKDVESWWHSNPAPETIIDVDYADFVNTSSTINNKRELAAFLANISKETTGGWTLPVGSGANGDYAVWGLYFVHEVGYNSSNGAGTYSQASTEYPPNSTKGYYGRGPIQLSWNYNYGQFSKFLYNDVTILLDNPDLVQQDGVLAFKSAIWFWMMPQCPKPTCHQVMQELWNPTPGDYTQAKMYKKGFAHTNNIINGGLECRTSSSVAFTEKVVLRSELYKYYMGIMGFSTTEITAEDTGEYTSLCYENSTNAMEDYSSCANFILNYEDFTAANFSLYPNPTKSNVSISNTTNITSIELFTVLGKRVGLYTPNKSVYTLNVDSLPSAMYLVRVTTGKQQTTLRFLKQ